MCVQSTNPDNLGTLSTAPSRSELSFIANHCFCFEGALQLKISNTKNKGIQLTDSRNRVQFIVLRSILVRSSFIRNNDCSTISANNN